MDRVEYPYLKVILGPMFSGKTTALMDIYEKVNKQRVIVINHAFDNRYDINYLCNHNGRKIQCEKVNDLFEFCKKNKNEYDIFLINEGQFFENLYKTVLMLVENENKHVVVCGLDGDYQRKPMGEIINLIPISDEIVKLKSNCRCGNKAIFTSRMINEKKQMLVGGSDMYEPLCRKCWLS
tara:strand:- start:15 stop:554 length:540 start_codon:yes stop_codon:yes gene_type:complete